MDTTGILASIEAVYGVSHLAGAANAANGNHKPPYCNSQKRRRYRRPALAAPSTMTACARDVPGRLRAEEGNDAAEVVGVPHDAGKPRPAAPSESVAWEPGQIRFSVTPAREEVVGRSLGPSPQSGTGQVGQGELTHGLLDRPRRYAADAAPNRRPARLVRPPHQSDGGGAGWRSTAASIWSSVSSRARPGGGPPGVGHRRPGSIALPSFRPRA